MNKINISDYDFLLDLGFSSENIEEQIQHWSNGVLQQSLDESFRHNYIENLKFFSSKYNEDECFVLTLFFSEIDAFQLDTLNLRENIDKAKSEFREKQFWDILYTDFCETGECKLLSLLSNTYTEIEFSNEISRLKNEYEEDVF